MIKKILIITGLISVLVLGVYIVFRPITKQFLPTQEIQIGGITVKAEIANNFKLRERGLSGHIPLQEDEGMLFVFERSGVYGFWMKEMLFPLDIIWVNDQKQIVYIKKDARPESYPEAFTPDTSALYVLELSSGFSDRHNLKIGDKVSF